MPPILTGSRLCDIRVLRTTMGYLDVFLTTDQETFEMNHDCVKYVIDISNAPSWIPASFKKRVVESIWTDGETLVVFLEGLCCIEYGFSLGHTDGANEYLRFLEGVETRTLEDNLKNDAEFKMLEQHDMHI